MIHLHCTSSARHVFRLALTSLALSTLAFAQEPKSDVAPGTPSATQRSTPTAGSPTKEKAKYLRYLRVKSGGAHARNLGDANGVSIATLSAGTLVAVYDELGDWLECEVPGGFEIWVYGKYVKASSEAGVLEITASDVRARPLPSGGSESYPLRPNLARGDRVRLITRNDSSKPLAEDWVKVYSPPGVRGFVVASECEALDSGADGASSWATAVLEARKRTPAIAIPAASGTGAAPGGPSVPGAGGAAIVGDLTPQQAIEVLKNADSALARERASATPDYEPVKEQYQLVLASVKEGATHDLAQRGLHEIEILAEVASLKALTEAEGNRMRQENLARQEAFDKIKNNNDLYAGRFMTRGWVEKRALPGQAPTYLLRWGGDHVAEIQCNSGRYDLESFSGYEVGVNGEEKRAYTAGDISHVAVPRLVNAERIEVLSGKLK
ncbi:MAG TPA: hypothetical protein VM509_02065 [Planctomycetota bacterium]|nr:hypothetical protein [Planctomycetota bacterium]